MPPRYYDADDVRKAAAGKWDQVLAEFGVDTSSLDGAHRPCPGCGGRDRFRYDDKNGEGTFICSQGTGEILSGDGIVLLAHVLGCEWKDAVRELGDRLIPEKLGRTRSESPRRGRATPRAPEAKTRGIKFDLTKLKRAQRKDWKIDEEFLLDASPVDLSEVTSPEDFLEAVYRPGERILIFQNYYGQGEFLYEVDRGLFRLADSAGIRAVPSDELPLYNYVGTWFLAPPVDGKWRPNPRKKPDENGQLELSRRIEECATDWRFMVLESDDAPEELWLNFLAQLALPIVAIYRSACRSIHALVRTPVQSKQQWDNLRDKLRPMLATFGADHGALSAVRLTRLPFCFRSIVTCPKCGKEQTSPGKRIPCKRCGEWLDPAAAVWRSQSLLYLNPNPDPIGVAIGEGGNKVIT